MQVVEKCVRGDDLFQTGETSAGEQGGGPAGVVKDGRHLTRAPNTDEHDRESVYVREQYSDPRGVSFESGVPLIGKQRRARKQTSIGQLLHRRILEDDLSWRLAGGS